MMSVNAQNTQNTQYKCGQNCQWTFADSTLKITGSGEMQNYFDDDHVPWTSHNSEIQTITIEGVATIGQKAFQNMKQLTSVQMNGVEEIGEAAFYNEMKICSPNSISRTSPMDIPMAR